MARYEIHVTGATSAEWGAEATAALADDGVQVQFNEVTDEDACESSGTWCGEVETHAGRDDWLLERLTGIDGEAEIEVSRPGVVLTGGAKASQQSGGATQKPQSPPRPDARQVAGLSELGQALMHEHSYDPHEIAMAAAEIAPPHPTFSTAWQIAREVSLAESYDPALALMVHVLQDPSHPPGSDIYAARSSLDSLETLQEHIAEQSDCTVVISDVHGSLELLDTSLKRLGVVDAAGNRQGSATLLQIGDLVDGRNPEDFETLEYGMDRFDVLIAGNHETALLGGKSFDGNSVPRPEIEQSLRRLARQGRLEIAWESHGVLVSHAGAHPDLFAASSAAEVSAQANEHWFQFLGRSIEAPELFDTDHHRGGTSAAGGMLWQDWYALLASPAANYQQIVGHTPLGGVEARPDAHAYGIDTGGDRLGIAVISEAGICFGSSIIPRTK